MSCFRNPKRFALAAALPSLAFFAAACALTGPQSTFDAQGPVARMQRDLFMVVFWTAVVVFIGVEGTLLYTVIRFRKKARADYPRQLHGHTPLEIAWTLAPTIVLTAIAVPTITTLFAIAREPGPDALEVKVVAHQWWWEFRYPESGVVTANEMHIPVDRDVRLTLEAGDVIHSFWVPKLAGKMDIIPGRTNRMWFRADAPGEYRGQCAEFCGIAHALMRYRVIAQAPDEFQTWLEAQKAPAAAPITEEAKLGASLFLSKGCVACHTIAGTGGSIFGPDLTHLASRRTLAAGMLENDPQGENLAQWLRDPGAIKPGNRMAELAPTYIDTRLALTEEEIRALVARLKTLQ